LWVSIKPGNKPSRKYSNGVTEIKKSVRASASKAKTIHILKEIES